MTKNRQSVAGRVLAASAAAALGLVTLAGVATATPVADGIPPGNIPDANESPTGSLNVQKHLGVPTGDAHNGQQLPTDPAGEKVAGVEFTAEEVGVMTSGSCVAIDLTDQAAWTDLEGQGVLGGLPTAPVAANDEDAQDGDLCFTGVKHVKTTGDATGVAVFPELPLGLYWVTESDSSGANLVGSGDPVSIVAPIRPFYVTIPYPSNTGTASAPVIEWLYNVYVYPKNQEIGEPTKEVESVTNDSTNGNTITWKVTQVVPELKADEEFTSASVTDVLDERLEYVADSAVLELDGNELDENDWEWASPDLTWKLTDSGLAKLEAAQGKELVVTFKTKFVGDDFDLGDGAIVNTPWDGEDPDNGYFSEFNGSRKPGGNEPVSYWGQLQILKLDATDSDVTLAGAEFEVYPAVVTPGEGEELATTSCPTTKPTTGLVAKGASDSDGVVQWEVTPATQALNLWIANAETPDEIAKPSKDYCVYETVAPTGYILPTGDSAWAKVTIVPGAVADANFQIIENTPADGPDLPLTGAAGTLLMTLGGIALIAVAGGILVVSRKKRANQA